jgi:hypothetical protein
MMQGIMWIVLGATVGLAALVDHNRRQAREVELGEPTRFREGFSLRLPEDWDREDDEAPDDPSTMVALYDTMFRRALVVRLERLTLTDLFGWTTWSRGMAGAGPRQSLGEIPFGDTNGVLTSRRVRVEDGPSITEITAFRPFRSTTLSITLIAPTYDRRKDVSSEVELVKRIAASMKVESSEGP